MQPDTKKEINALLKDLTVEQQKDVLYFMAMLIARRKGIEPERLLNIINNWEKIERAIHILK